MTRHVRPLPDQLGEFAGITFQRERLAPVLRELLPLIEADWRENGIDHEAVPLNIALDKYLDYDLLGILQLVTARDQGPLVGYVLNFIHPNMRHKRIGWAIVDFYWLFPEYRGRGIGTALMQANLKFLKDADVAVVEASEKVHKAHGLWAKLGFEATDTVYRKLMEH